MSGDGVLAEWLRWVVLIASGSLDRASGMHFHRGVVNRLRQRRPAPAAPAATSRPALPRVVGQVPAVALVDEIEAGNIRALFVTGGNPLTAFPQPDRLEAALRTLALLAVVDVADSPLTAIATHVLPATGQLERADITLAELTALRSGLQATKAVMPAGSERRPVWWMFAALDRAMGRDTLGGVDPNDLSDEDYLRGVLAHSSLDADEVFAAGPRGIETAAEHGWVHDELLPGGRWTISPAPLLARLAMYTDPEPARFVLAPRREMAWSNSVAYGANNGVAVVRMHPGTSPAGARVALDDAARPRDRRHRGRSGGARRRDLDDARARRREPGQPHERRRVGRPAHRHAPRLRPRGAAHPARPARLTRRMPAWLSPADGPST